MTWSVVWSYAGQSGETEDVAASWSESVSLARSVGNWRSVSLSIVIPLDVMALSSRGHHPRTGGAILSSDHEPVMSGPWSDVSVTPLTGGATRVDFTLSQRDTEDVGVFPPLSKSRPVRDPNERVGWADARVATARERVRLGFPAYRPRLGPEVYVQDPILRKDRWPNIAEPAEGAGWPYPFGKPGGRGADFPAVPAYMVVEGANPSLRRILIAGCPISASTVTVWGPSTAGGTDLTSDTGVAVLTAEDDDGFTYSYVRGPSLSNVAPDPGNSFWWSSPGGSTTPGGAGDLLLTILSASSVQYDAAAFARLAPLLNRYQLDGYVDALSAPLDLIRDQILPLLPISLLPGPDGLRPVLLPFLRERGARGIAVVDGIGVCVEGPIRFADPIGTDRVAVRYGYRADRGRMTQRVIVGRDEVLRSRFALQGLTEADARFLWDPVTAGRVAQESATLGSWAPRVVSLLVTQPDTYGPGAALDLDVGRQVVFTSSALGLSGVPAVVGEREYDATRSLVRLWLLDDPLVAS